jgi:hypothetical protein
MTHMRIKAYDIYIRIYTHIYPPLVSLFYTRKKEDETTDYQLERTTVAYICHGGRTYSVDIVSNHAP